MTTFTQWLHDQEKREDDPVGWFARYWRDLDQRPRLSSPASIARHLEDRGLFEAEKPHLQQAYDATLREYRHVRDQTVQQVSGVDLSAPQEPLPGMPGVPAAPPPVSPAAAVEQAARAGMAAAAAARAPQTQLDRIEASLEAIAGGLAAILEILGLANPADAAESLPEIPWGDLFAAADMTAEAG